MDRTLQKGKFLVYWSRSIYFSNKTQQSVFGLINEIIK
jgi:hypothetical protein